MHNYLSRDGTLPLEFLAMVKKELDGYGVTRNCSRAVAVKKMGSHGFEVTDAKGEKHLCRRLLLATGVTDNIPEVPGMQELWGKGVYHCPYCDGYELCDKVIGLYAKRFSGYGMAVALTQLSKKLILFTDGSHYLSSAQRSHLDSLNIRVESKRLAELSCDEDRLTCVKLQNGDSIGCDAVFVHNGYKSNNDLFLQLGGRCTSKGAAVTNRRQQCSVSGVYVAGDAALDVQFVIVAAAEGAKAAVSIHDDLLRQDNMLVKIPAAYKAAAGK